MPPLQANAVSAIPHSDYGFLNCAVCKARGYRTEFRQLAPHTFGKAGVGIWKLRHWHREISDEMYVEYKRQQSDNKRKGNNT